MSDMQRYPRVVKIPRWSSALVYALCAAGVIMAIATAPDPPGWLVWASTVIGVVGLTAGFAAASGAVQFEYKEKPGE